MVSISFDKQDFWLYRSSVRENVLRVFNANRCLSSGLAFEAHLLFLESYLHSEAHLKTFEKRYALRACTVR